MSSRDPLPLRTCTLNIDLINPHSRVQGAIVVSALHRAHTYYSVQIRCIMHEIRRMARQLIDTQEVAFWLYAARHVGSMRGNDKIFIPL